MRRSSGGFVRTLIFGGLLAVVAYAVVAAIGWDLLPFQTTEKDHSPPPILAELRELSDLHAAQAEFEVVVDQEQDVRFVPQAIAGERVQFVAVGTVDAVVDLTRLPIDAVRYDAATDSAVVYLPRPTIAEPVLDVDQSHVMNRDRGLLNRLGGVFTDNPTSELGLYEAARDKMSAAAARTGLVTMAEEQAESLLEPLVRQLGVTTVEVRFYDGDAPPDCERVKCS
jgi:Protein of unknown function (DUF4230)